MGKTHNRLDTVGPNVIDGFRVERPGQDHPNPTHWATLRAAVVAKQGGRCGTCWAEGRDLHHRHYSSWGVETEQDVILLCGPCHESITSRIRGERYALVEGGAPTPGADHVPRVISTPHLSAAPAHTGEDFKPRVISVTQREVPPSPIGEDFKPRVISPRGIS